MTGSITGGFGITAIYYGTDTLTVNVDTAEFGIIPVGSPSLNVNRLSDGDIIISHRGDIDATSTPFSGIYALIGGLFPIIRRNGTITIDHTGNITSNEEAIFAVVTGNGAINVSSAGILTSTNSWGHYLFIGIDGDINSSNTGDIVAEKAAIEAQIGVANVGSGNITIRNTGNLTSQLLGGIFTRVASDGVIRITNQGTIGSFDDGIYGRVNGEGDVIVNNTADITSVDQEGIDAEVGINGNIFVNHSGTIHAYDEAIDASVFGNGDIFIVSSGHLTSQSRVGIDALIRANGNIAIANTGDISAQNAAILGINGNGGRRGNGNISIINFGNLTSADNNGILASVGRNGNISVFNAGNINSYGDAIYVENGRNLAPGQPQRDRGRGNLSVLNIGKLNSTLDSGIYIGTKRGHSDIVVTNQGAVNAGYDGIEIETRRSHGSVVVNNFSAISSGRVGISVGRGDGGQSPATINNHALVSGGNGFAIDLWQNGHDTVNLFGGSVLVGAIDFGDGNDNMGGANPDDIDRLNVMPGVNAELRFADEFGTDSDLQSAPEIINLAGGGTLIDGGTGLVAVDATGFSVQSTFISDLTDSLLNLVDLPNTGTGTGGSTHGGNAATSGGAAFNLWASGFGGYRDQRASSRLAASDHRFAGIAAGMELTSDEALGTVGLIGGYGRSQLNLAFEAGHTEINSYYGGAYWKGDFEAYQINLTLLGGLTDNATHRSVGTVTGRMTARSRYNGWFISPALTLAAPINTLPIPMLVSGRVNYVGLHLDGYSEEGTTLPLTVARRSVSLVNTRAQVSFPQLHNHNNGSHTHVDMRLGVDATIDAGSDSVAASVIGVPFGFDVTAENTLAGFASLGIAHTSADGMKTLSFNAEIQ